MRWKEALLSPDQQDVLAAVFAYDNDGRRRFRESKGIKKADWRRTLAELANMDLVTAKGELTGMGEKQVHALPKAIWSDI